MQLQAKNKLFGLINQSEIARRLSIKPQSVSLWLNTGNIPPRKIIPFCAATGYAITPHQVDADLYPNPTDGLPIERQNTTKEN
uniref:Cro/Cl family transcriptional regulator n=1 Tax=Hafnia alvei TaxID=569 RepID=UPI00242F661B|nr:Cro/Cl family transcriptional regulator [Hafnia alvei]